MVQSKNYAVLFDCDGVLVDSEPALAEIAAKVFQNIDIPAHADDFIPYIGTGEDTYLGEVMKKYGVEYDPNIKQDVYALYVEQSKQYVKSFPGCLDLLQVLKNNNIKMAVASSADKIKVDANIQALGFNDFDAIISGSDVERKKPFPDIYILAANKVDTASEDCIVIEDATAGIESGNAANMITIGFTSEHSREELQDAGADYVVDDFSEMQALLKELLKF